MVNLVLSGLTPSYLSSYCGNSKRTITLWVKTADEQGFAGAQTQEANRQAAEIDERANGGNPHSS